MENRLDELESRAAFQEHTLSTLNEVVIELQQEIAELRHEIEAIKAQLRALATVPVAGPRDETPPHY